MSNNVNGDGPLVATTSNHAPSNADGDGASDSQVLSSTPTATRRSTARLSRTNTQNGKEVKDGKALSRSPTPSSPITSGLDPLSKQIYLRTNSQHENASSIAQRLRSTDISTEDPEPSPELSNKPSNPNLDASKDWRRGSSGFFSRFSMRTGWKREEDGVDSDSEVGESRDDGANARALTTVVGAGGGYIPFYKEPPRYIRVHQRNKKEKEFNRLFLAQELSIGKKREDREASYDSGTTAVGNKILKGNDAIWTAEFSLDGKYLAVAGKDTMVHVFAVISTPEDRKAHEEDEQYGGNGEKLSAPVFKTKPISVFRGHTGDVLALSWSKNNFLLSSSMDKTVKLWHLSRAECLCTFKHGDLVTSIAFHPKDDRFFLAGSLDSQLRLWSIPDKSIAFSATTSEFITAVAFTPDGGTAICGLLNGMCMFYETKGLKYQTQIHVRSSRGKNAKGSKITGIRTAGVDQDVKVLVSSNDSRLRLYSFNTKTLDIKFKAHECQGSQIHARYSEDAKHIITGSEDGKAYIWGPVDEDAENKEKQPYEYFDAHPHIVTVALMAPTRSKQLLGASGDPIFDLCNPPPVQLVSLDESQATLSDGGQSERGFYKKPEETPAYVERSKHLDGNIVVTTDRLGNIKVFRQDCAFAKRQQNIWETGSKFSGKLAGVGRSASIRTKASNGSRAPSRRSSLSLMQSPVPAQTASDRIMSWRQDVDLRPGRSGTPTQSERSVSPSKIRPSYNMSGTNLASEARRMPYATGSLGRNSMPGSPAPSVSARRSSGARLSKDQINEERPNVPPVPGFSIRNADAVRDGESSFWNLSRWRGGSRLSIGSSPSVLEAPDNSRLTVEDRGERRRSGRIPRSKSALGILEQPETPERPTSGKKRVDSGMSRGSESTTDGSRK